MDGSGKERASRSTYPGEHPFSVVLEDGSLDTDWEGDMKRGISRLGGLLLAVTLGACAPASESADRPPSYGNGTVLTSMELGNQGELLRAIRNGVSGMSVRHSSSCPSIVLRGSVAQEGATNPKVYVDGTGTTNTCVLEGLRSADVERVEIYPAGYTTRPGYAPHSKGLILVFTKRAS